MNIKVIQPTYTCKQPSTGKTISFRPYVSREEKALLLALQTDDLSTIINSLKNAIHVCTDGMIDPNKVPYYDLEYIFLQIRSKSVGEVIDMIGKCDCSNDSSIEFTVDIGNTVIEPKPEGTKKFKISNTKYTVEINHPTIDSFAASLKAEDDTSDIIADCILSVYTDDEVLETNHNDRVEFIDSLTPIQKADLIQFIKNMPRVKLSSQYKCRKCNKTHDYVLSGFENFFV